MKKKRSYFSVSRGMVQTAFDLKRTEGILLSPQKNKEEKYHTKSNKTFNSFTNQMNIQECVLGRMSLYELNQMV